MTPLGFTERLRASRAAARLKQTDVASTLSYTPATVANWENGRTSPSLADVASLAALYRVSADWLLTGRARLPHRFTDAEEPSTDKGPRCRHAIPIGERCLPCEGAVGP